MIFKERTIAPSQNNPADYPYYFNTTNNPYQYDYGMPNCTSYCLGRMNELLDLNSMSYPNYSGFLGNAEVWGQEGYIGENWERGNTPKLGAIAVWERAGGGHVAFVEGINSDNTIKTSNSGWAGEENIGNEECDTWWWIANNVDVTNYGSYTFIYYLYPPYIDDTPIPPDPPEPKPPTFIITKKSNIWLILNNKRKRKTLYK